MLVQLEEVLAFAELDLLFVKLFAHEHLALNFCLFFILAFYELLQNGVLVQGCPLVNLVLEAADNACLIIAAEILAEAFAQERC